MYLYDTENHHSIQGVIQNAGLAAKVKGIVCLYHLSMLHAVVSAQITPNAEQKIS